ncbi:MAG: helix-turn-helix transcriptional regulator [Eubacteriales bacterium]|nr:helix-turn-helix transcriptional regulator [Eubacteriales bacterium]
MIIKENAKARKILANNLIYFRLDKGWSQEDFADKLGTTPTYVSTLENAKRNTRIDYIGHLADTLEVSLEQLFIDRPSVKNHRIPRR